MHTFFQTLLFNKDSLAPLLCTSRSILHSSLAPNLVNHAASNKLRVSQDEEALDETNNVINSNQNNNNKITLTAAETRLLFLADTIEFTQSLDLDFPDWNLKHFMLQRLTNSRYSCRSLKKVFHLQPFDGAQVNFVKSHCEIIEEFHAAPGGGQLASLIQLLGDRFSSTLKKLSLSSNSSNTSFFVLKQGNIKNLARSLMHLELRYLGSATSCIEDMLELGHLKKLRSLTIVGADGVGGGIFGKIFSQLPLLNDVTFVIWDGLRDLSCLNEIAALRKISLSSTSAGSWNDIDETAFRDWKEFPCLEILDLTEMPVSNEQFERFLPGSCSFLKVFRLRSACGMCDITPQIVKLLSSSSSLEEIVISNSARVTSESLKEGLSKSSNLKVLELGPLLQDDNDNSKSFLIEAAIVPKFCHSLQKLHLTKHKNFGIESMIAVGRLNVLREFSLTDMHLMADISETTTTTNSFETPPFPPWAGPITTSLTKVSCCQVYTPKCLALLWFLENCTRIEELTLDSTDFVDISHIAKSLKIIVKLNVSRSKERDSERFVGELIRNNNLFLEEFIAIDNPRITK